MSHVQVCITSIINSTSTCTMYMYMYMYVVSTQCNSIFIVSCTVYKYYTNFITMVRVGACLLVFSTSICAPVEVRKRTRLLLFLPTIRLNFDDGIDNFFVLRRWKMRSAKSNES